ncbi:MAG: hypothetical protein WCO98_03410 [bacterium]
MTRHLFWLFISLFVLIFSSNILFAQKQVVSFTNTGNLKTPVELSNIDATVFAEYVDGKETVIEKDPLAKDPVMDGTPQILWTQTTRPGYRQRNFGFSKKVGSRYLRIGFTKSIPVGTVMTEGNVAVSVLKQDIPYPGNLADDTQWIAAQRVKDGKISADEITNAEDTALWILPAGTQTRTIRFTHIPEQNDNVYSGVIKGIYILADRYVNIAPQGISITHSNNQYARKINDEKVQTQWENISAKDKEQRAKKIADDPEWLFVMWQQPVTLNGLMLVIPGFSAADIQSYTGPDTTHPRDAGNEDWTTIKTISGLKNQLGGVFEVYGVDFDKPVTSRAIRVRITAVIDERPAHTQGSTMTGTRVWINDLMALKAIGNAPIETAIPETTAVKTIPQPPIPVKFSIPEDGYVTLVIEDSNGIRVRNLVSEKYFPKGDNIIGWDGTDDLGRDVDAAKHGLYRIPAHPVQPGDYKVRGLWHKAIDPKYELSVYNEGNPPWGTPDHTGAWLANHTPPQAALFVPAEKSPTGEPIVLLGAYVTEGPDGLIWTDLDGNKRGGMKWLGGAWTAAPFLTADNGTEAVAEVSAYAASVWETGKLSNLAELRVTALSVNPDKSPLAQKLLDKLVLKLEIGTAKDATWKINDMSGFAVYNSIMVFSFNLLNKIMFVNIKTGKILGSSPLDGPTGMTFDAKGQLLILSGKKLLKFAKIDETAKLPEAVTVIDNLEDPVGITLDKDGNIYISDRGNSHQVKVFTADGKLIRAIGNPGAPKTGPYDQMHMNSLMGIAIDSRNQLWVTERHFVPKRVSVWTLDGKFIKAFYGPTQYGGGGKLDPADKNKYYYAEGKTGGMEFKIDWPTGTWKLTNVTYLSTPGQLKLPGSAPDTALYLNGHRYFTNCYNDNPTTGAAIAFLFIDINGVATPVAAMGRANSWDILKDDSFKTIWPTDTDLKGDMNKNNGKNQAFFIWNDTNGDRQIQKEEITMKQGKVGTLSVMPDLSFCVSSINGNSIQYSPASINKDGVPTYDITKGKVLATGVKGPASSGGNQILVDKDNNVVLTLGVEPFHQYSLCGVKNGKAVWSYPSVWPGLHASHSAGRPSFPGELIGTTRLLGGFVTPKDSDAGPLWAVNGNMGNMYIFTSDGLFVATIFEDVRNGVLWKMPAAKRGMSLKGITLHDENFWPTLNQTPDGTIYIMDGNNASLVRLDGIESIRRISITPLKVTAEDLQKANKYLLNIEKQRQQEQGNGILKVAMPTTAPVVDGKLDDWNNAEWVDIEKAGVKANFNSTSMPYDVRGAVAIADGTLFAAWNTGDAKLLQNTGEQANSPFKTGGCLDIMLATDPTAKPDRKSPTAGDLRLLITMVANKIKAVLYRPVVPGTPDAEKIPFSSPWRTITFDKVEDVSSKVKLAFDKTGNYEISVKLDTLGFTPKAGMKVKGDIGILRGSDGQTTARVYWSNKATAIVADVPSEAELLPDLWGMWLIGN